MHEQRDRGTCEGKEKIMQTTVVQARIFVETLDFYIATFRVLLTPYMTYNNVLKKYSKVTAATGQQSERVLFTSSSRATKRGIEREYRYFVCAI